MIGYLEGTLKEVSLGMALVVANGVGYEVSVSTTFASDLQLSSGRDVSLYIHTHWNDSHFQLFGFSNVQEREVFRTCLSVSGVGPKMALALVSTMPWQDLMNLVMSSDVDQLTKVPGVGKKTAQRLVVELKDKFEKLSLAKVLPISSASGNAEVSRVYVNADARVVEATQALVSLGYSEQLSRKALSGLDVTEEDTVQSLIKKSLVRVGT
jgi:Holliday junction DNA helicase RuvA